MAGYKYKNIFVYQDALMARVCRPWNIWKSIVYVNAKRFICKKISMTVFYLIASHIIIVAVIGSQSLVKKN